MTTSPIPVEVAFLKFDEPMIDRFMCPLENPVDVLEVSNHSLRDIHLTPFPP